MSLKLHNKRGEGKALKDSFNIRGYPSVIFLKENGAEIDRIFGYGGDKEKFVNTVKEYVAGKNTYRTLLTNVREEPDNIEANYAIAKKLIDRGEGFEAYDYMMNILKLDPDDEKGHAEEMNFYLGIYEMWKDDDVKALQSFLAETAEQEYLLFGYDQLVRYFKEKKDTAQVIAAYEASIQKMPDDASFINGYAWLIYQLKFEEKYESAIKLTEKAVTIRPEEAHIWDTLAWLYFETGQKDLAIKTMEKAVSLVPDDNYYKENLKKMKEVI